MFDSNKAIRKILGDKYSNNNTNGCSVCGGPCKPQKDCPEVLVCQDKKCSVHDDY